VFFFSCSCGSRVFFEELGEPWPVHDCRSTSGSDGSTFGLDPVTASVLVRAHARRNGLAVPSLPWERATMPVAREHAIPIARTDPVAKAKASIVGVVREVSDADGTARRLGVKAGSLLDRQVLRHFPPVTVQLTVHVGGLEAGQLLSYTLWIAPELLAGNMPSPGDVVVQGLAAAWVGERMSRIG
jgi:hypothetical protein